LGGQSGSRAEGVKFKMASKMAAINTITHNLIQNVKSMAYSIPKSTFSGQGMQW